MSRATSSWTKEQLRKVIAREPAAVAAFVKEFGPVLRGAVRRLLQQWQRPALQEDDLVQELLLALFHDEARVLCAWDPDKGRSLRVYLITFAHHRGIDRLRAATKEEPMEDEQLHLHVDRRAQLETQPTAAEELDEVVVQFRKEASPEEWRLFELMVLEGRSTEEMMQALGLTQAALYQRKHRLRERLHALKKKLLDE